MTMSTGNMMSPSAALSQYFEPYAYQALKLKRFFYDANEKRSKPTGQASYVLVFTNRGVTTPEDLVMQEGITPPESSTNFRKIVVSCTKFGLNEKYTDIVLQDSPIDAVQAIVVELARRVGEGTDKIIQRKLVADGVNVLYAGNVASRAAIASTSIATASDLSDFNALLSKAGVMDIDGAYVGVFHTYQVNDLRADATVGGLIDVRKYSQPDKILNGEVGKMHGIRIVESNNIESFDAAGLSGQDVYPAFLFGKEAYCVVETTPMKTTIIPPGTGNAVSDPHAQIGSVAIDIRFGVTLMRQEALWRYETSAKIKQRAAY